MAGKSDDRRGQATPEQKEDARRLRAIWDEVMGKRRAERSSRYLTQQGFADKYGEQLDIGKSASAVGNRLNGEFALNLKAAVAFATELGVPISKFSPRLQAEQDALTTPGSVTPITNPALQLAVEFDALPEVLDWIGPSGKRGTKQDVLAELLGVIQERQHFPPSHEDEAKAPPAEPTPAPAPGRKKRRAQGHARSRAGSGESPT